MPVAVDTSSSIYDDFSRLLFFHAHRASSALTDELQEESGQFRFLHTACLTNLKGSVDGVDFGEIFGYEDFFTTLFFPPFTLGFCAFLFYKLTYLNSNQNHCGSLFFIMNGFKSLWCQTALPPPGCIVSRSSLTPVPHCVTTSLPSK
jgi:hypothetical protein